MTPFNLYYSVSFLVAVQLHIHHILISKPDLRKAPTKTLNLLILLVFVSKRQITVWRKLYPLVWIGFKSLILDKSINYAVWYFLLLPFAKNQTKILKRGFICFYHRDIGRKQTYGIIKKFCFRKQWENRTIKKNSRNSTQLNPFENSKWKWIFFFDFRRKSGEGEVSYPHTPEFWRRKILRKSH